MSGFALGIFVGCFAGALGTLLLLQVVDNIPDGDYFRKRMPESWFGPALMIALILLSGAAFVLLDLRRVAFATSVLLLLVFLAAHARGMLASWTILTLAALLLCVILPPARTLGVADPQDRVLLLCFVLCGAIGSRMIAHAQKA